MEIRSSSTTVHQSGGRRRNLYCHKKESGCQKRKKMPSSCILCFCQKQASLSPGTSWVEQQRVVTCTVREFQQLCLYVVWPLCHFVPRMIALKKSSIFGLLCSEAEEALWPIIMQQASKLLSLLIKKWKHNRSTIHQPPKIATLLWLLVIVINFGLNKAKTEQFMMLWCLKAELHYCYLAILT